MAIQVAVFALLVGATAMVLIRASHTDSALAVAGAALTARPTGSARGTPSPSALPRSTTAQNTGVEAGGGTGAAGSTTTARLSIPRIGIRNAPIFDRGTDAKGVMLIASGYAVTHYASSAGFGRGNAVLYGHDDIQGNVFAKLYDLNAGDVIEVSVGSQTQQYRVTGHQIVAPTAVGVLAPTGDVRLTIITCWPFNVDTKRWIVTATKA